jgi:hypothetical protein
MEPISNPIQQYLDDTNCVTAGSYTSEESAKDAFRSAFAFSDCFAIYEEIEGWYFGGSVFGDRSTGRIDFILTPKKRLIEAGWRMGIVGVEVKKSGHKAGPLVCQMLDYSKAVFRLPAASGGSLVCASVICCFPEIVGITGCIKSIMSQHRIGVARIDKWGTNILVNSTNIFKCTDHGIECKAISSGYKNGSR